MPFGRATFCRTARVTPEQSPPMMPLTPSAVTMRSADAWATAASVQVVSPRTETKFQPLAALPEAFTSAIASSAAAAICGVSDSMAPVKPISTPSFTSSAIAAPDIAVMATEARSSFFILFSRVGS